MTKKNSKTPLTVSRPDLLVDGSDEAFRDLLSDLFAFSQHLQETRARFAGFVGLSPAQYMILIAIDRLEDSGDMGINQVAAHLHYSGAFVTIEVNHLVKAGLVAKAPHPTDGRRVVLRVTPAGRATLARLAAFQAPVNDALFAPLDAESFSSLCRIMQSLSDNGDKAVRLAEYLHPATEDRFGG
ncbi:MarR family winged helix-turn-helix transcriptional regulator [Rhizobiaceae bacterium BDR2-2]|uniref:MarR family winged helix-turn-helix transcriptional regulator n=1 Tax=Ectorhizobium quercum TaxID=2965071 RepID=A0AAE3MZ19_9HYPH|nr:MarR family winged helix-turn-helix transcriptional regulator [Ectorhizobium quercum]MCX8997101.1 MarR family winged helix-turn-helix transcriptional regulator [Ectorhizobium quercum]